jgi:ABC-type nitrate/sulfonate/bicarbonate transport system substrate-binding protein
LVRFYRAKGEEMKKASLHRRGRIGGLLLALALVTAVGATAAPSASQPAAKVAAPISVTIAVGPFLDNQPLRLAAAWGLDKQVGLSFKSIVLPSNNAIFQALRTGDAHVGAGTVAGLPPIVKQAPELRNWAIKDQFLGYFIVGRKGAGPVYADLIRNGVAPRSATRQVLSSFLGKSFCIVRIQNWPVVEGALQAIGLDPSRVDVKDFADDAKAAQAFLSGACDFYTGSLPQQAKLLLDYPARFVAVGGYEILGPGALWYDTWTSTDSWLQANEDTALRVLAVHYRVMRYIQERPNWVAPELTKLVNEASAGSLPVSQVKFLMQRFSLFHTPAQAQQRAYNPRSPFYWLNQANFIVKQNVKSLPAGYNVRTWEVEDVWFNKFLARKDLVRWVKSPLTKPKVA